MEPSVKIVYSESSLDTIKEGEVIPLGVANRLFEQRDVECEDAGLIENVMYEISYVFDGAPHEYHCSQNLGDGDGSVINHIRIGALEALKMLQLSSSMRSSSVVKSPFSILEKSYDDMLNRVLPELEAYCIAYKTHEILTSYGVDNCNFILLSDVPELSDFVKEQPNNFVLLLEDVIARNPENTSLVSYIETTIIKAQQFSRLCQKTSLEETLKEATQKATVINENSILNVEVPKEDVALF